MPTPPTKTKPARAPRRPANRGRLANGAANPIDVHVGVKVRTRRTLLGLSQEKLGEMIGLTFQQVQKYERGANRISCSRLFDISRALHVSVGYFFEDIREGDQAASPVAIAKGSSPEIHEREENPMLRRETLELVRNFESIADPHVRKMVSDLALTVGGTRSDHS